MINKKNQSKSSIGDAHAYLRFVKNMGGRVQLCKVQFSSYIIQGLVNLDQVKVTNTGVGFYLELEAKK